MLRAEAGRLVRHPVLLAGVAGTALLQTSALGQMPDVMSTQWWSTKAYYEMGSLWFAMYGAAFVAGNLVALRDRETTTAEALRAVPVTRHHRTLALLWSGAVPVVLAALVSLYVAALVSRLGGMPVGDVPGPERIPLTPWEVVVPLAVTAAAYTAGVAVARLIPHPIVGVFLGVVGSMALTAVVWVWMWYPAGFLVPFAVATREGESLGPNPGPETLASHTPLLAAPKPWSREWRIVELEPGRVGWHALYMVGLAVVWAGVALARSGTPARRGWWTAGVGVLLAVAGFVLQVRSTGQTWTFLDSTS